MESAEQAAAYANADFEAPHSRFLALFREVFPGADIIGQVLDAGCGAGDIALRFARAFPRCRVIGVDGSAAMLEQGRQILSRQPPELRDRVLLAQGRLPHNPLDGERFNTIISNSLLHHLPEPQVLWQTLRTFARPGARIFIMDLMRPDGEETARRLAEQYCAGEPDILRRDFFNSLLAAFSPEEIRDQLVCARLDQLEVQTVSDRHVMIWGQMK